MHPFRSSTFLLTAALAAAQGQTPPDHRHNHDEPLALENFVVSASPYARSQADIAQPTSVLAGRELTLRMAPTLGELLAGQPGVSSSSFGPGASRPVIRGLGSDRIRVLENSLGTTDASIISPDHAVSLDPLLIERVEVVRGPAALLYGGNAVGGVVNVITHRIHTSLPDATVQGRLEARGNSADREDSAGLVLEGATGNVAWHADYYHRRTSDVKIPGFAESARRRAMEEEEHHHDDDDDHGHDDDHDDDHDEEEPIFGRIPNTALRNEGGAFGVSFIGRRGYFGLAHSVHDSRYGIPAGVHVHHHGEEEHDDHDHDEDHDDDHGDEHGEEDENVTIDLRQRRWEFQGEITEPFGVFRGARFKLGTARYRHTEFEGDEVGTVFRNRGYDGRAEFLHQPFGAFTGAISWQGGRSDFEADGDEAFVPPSRTTTNALFVFEEAEMAPFTWQLGARVENQDLALREDTGAKRDDTTVSGSTGLVWKLNDTWTLATYLARTERAPNVQELYADGPHAATGAYEIGNPGLRRERSLALDISLRKRVGFVTGAVTVFTNRFNGFIFEVPTGETAVPHDDHWDIYGHDDHDDHEDETGLPVYRFIQRDAGFHGAELEAVFHLHGYGEKQLDLIVGADLVRGRNQDDRDHLPRITPSRLKTGLAWSHGPIALGGEVQWVASQHRTAPNELPTDSYELVSAYATYRHVAGRTVWDFFLRGTNLSDAEARVHTSLLKDVAPLAGRSVQAGVRLSF
jgi:iron complex outermembrane receptor protein